MSEQNTEQDTEQEAGQKGAGVEETAQQTQEVQEAAEGSQEATHAPEGDTEAGEADEADQEGQQDDQATAKLRAEAKKYRQRLRDAEAERDSLAEQVEQLRTTQAEAAIHDVLAKPSALWMTGITAAEFYSEGGTLDVDGLRKAAVQAKTEHGLQGFRRFGGSADTGSRATPTPAPSFADAFKPH